MKGNYTMNKIRILAVDDEEGVLNVIKSICRNHEVTAETSPLKALEIIRKEKFDIFIIDYQMPVINGIELLEKIQNEYESRHHVSIFCTAFGTIHLFKTELLQGLFDFFIEKPFEINTLKDVMKKSILLLGNIRNKYKKYNI